MVGALYGLHLRATAALPHPQHSGLARAALPSRRPFIGVLVLLAATEIGLINFDDAAQLFEVVAARLAKPAEHEPRALLRDADFLGELHRRNPLARGDDEVHRVDPLMQRDVGALHNRASADSEIFLALVAAVVSAFAGRNPLAETTNRAARAVRPEAAFKPYPPRFCIGNKLEKLEGRNRALAHGLTLGLCEDYTAFWQGSKLYNSLNLLFDIISKNVYHY